MVGFGVPINEFSFGNTLISAGTTAIVGGLIIFALGVTVGQLRRIAEALAHQGPRERKPKFLNISLPARRLPHHLRAASHILRGQKPNRRRLVLARSATIKRMREAQAVGIRAWRRHFATLKRRRSRSKTRFPCRHRIQLFPLHRQPVTLADVRDLLQRRHSAPPRRTWIRTWIRAWVRAWMKTVRCLAGVRPRPRCPHRRQRQRVRHRRRASMQCGRLRESRKSRYFRVTPNRTRLHLNRPRARRSIPKPRHQNREQWPFSNRAWSTVWATRFMSTALSRQNCRRAPCALPRLMSCAAISKRIHNRNRVFRGDWHDRLFFAFLC